MNNVSIPLSKMGTIAAICELATVMKAPAIADPGDGAPKGTVLQLQASVFNANISLDQLATARKLLRLIYMTNQQCFCDSASANATSYCDEEDAGERPVKDAYTRVDLLDAIALGTYAAKANIKVVESDRNGELYLKADNGKVFSVTISDSDLHLATEIFMVACVNNNFENGK